MSNNIPYTVMLDGRKSTCEAAKGMVDGKGYPTWAVGWESWRLPTISEAQGIPKGLLVQGKAKLSYEDGYQTGGSSFFTCPIHGNCCGEDNLCLVALASSVATV